MSRWATGSVVAGDLGRPAGEVAQVLGRERHVHALGELDRLAVVERLELGQLVGVRLEGVGERQHRARALGGGDAAPAAVLERLAGGADGAVDVLGAGVRHLGDRPAGGGVERLERAARRRPRGARRRSAGGAARPRTRGRRRRGRPAGLEAVVMPRNLGERGGRAHRDSELDAAQRVELQPHAVAGLGGVRRREDAGDDALARGRSSSTAGQAPGSTASTISSRCAPVSPGAITCSTSPLTRMRPAPGAVASPRAGRTRPRGGRCCRPGSSRRPGRGRAGRRPRAPAAGPTIERASSPSSTATSDSTTTGPSSSDTSAPSSSSPSVVRKPASGPSMPSFCWAPETLKPTFQPIGSAPWARISRRRTSIAVVPRSTLTASSRS